MKTASSRYGLAAAGLLLCLTLGACGGGGGLAFLPGQGAPAGNGSGGGTPPATGGGTAAEPALKCAP